MKYSQALTYLQGLPFYETKSTVHDRMSSMCHALDINLRAIQYLHVTGSKGKGSVSTFAAHILQSAGYKVGLFLSPHIKEHTERITILTRKQKQIISKKQFSQLIEKIKTISEKNKIPLGIFEIYTLSALNYFVQEKVDIAVIEVGMGGRFDPTNIIPSKVQIITNIELEHTKELGDTISKISYEKAGIIKNNSVCIVGDIQRDVLIMLSDIAQQNHAKLFIIEESDIEILSMSLKGNVFNFERYAGLETSLIGNYQCKNAALAICATNALQNQGIKISEDAVRMGLKNATIPLRMHIVSREPLIILDGCHTRNSIAMFFRTINSLTKQKNKTIIVGFSKGKDIKLLCATLCASLDSTATHIIVTKSQLKGEDEISVMRILKTICAQSIHIKSAPTLKIALRLAQKHNTIICVIGSLYLCSEWRCLKN